MDKKQFAELLGKYTKISKRKISEYLEKGTVNDLFQNPYLITSDASKVQRLEDLKLLRNTYDNLKDYSLKYTISTPRDAAEFFKNFNMDVQDKEYFHVAYLNTKNQIIDVSTTEGTINSVLLYKREIIKEAFQHNASSIMISHNHPSGDPKPSQEDLALTGTIYNACQTVGIRLVDHVITADMNHYSVREHHPDFDRLSHGKYVHEKSGDYEKRPSLLGQLKEAKAESESLGSKADRQKDSLSR